VHDEVEAIERFRVRLEDGVELVIAAGVALADPGVGLAELLDGLARAPDILLAGQGGVRAGAALLSDGARDVPGVGTVVGDAEDEASLAL